MTKQHKSGRRSSGSESAPLLSGQQASSCSSPKVILNDLIAIGMPAALSYTFYEFCIGKDPEKIILLTKGLDVAEGLLFLKALYDFWNATTTLGKVTAVLSGLKCLLAAGALTYNLKSGENEQVAPSMFVGVFCMATLTSLITACSSQASKVDSKAQGFNAGAHAATVVGIFVGLILKIQTETCGYGLSALQGAVSLANTAAAFFRPAVASTSLSVSVNNAEAGLRQSGDM